jgi:hypothetical protein
MISLLRLITCCGHATTQSSQALHKFSLTTIVPFKGIRAPLGFKLDKNGTKSPIFYYSENNKRKCQLSFDDFTYIQRHILRNGEKDWL